MTLKELLNKLIEKGWRPFGDNAIKFDYDGMKTRYGYGAITYKYRDSYIDDYGDRVECEEWRHQFNNRELVSKESGLWQFVCKNKLYRWQVFVWLTNTEGFHDEFGDSDYQFRLIESALCDEDKLEQFLLDNIKI